LRWRCSNHSRGCSCKQQRHNGHHLCHCGHCDDLIRYRQRLCIYGYYHYQGQTTINLLNIV
jgi:hypothetical protein